MSLPRLFCGHKMKSVAEVVQEELAKDLERYFNEGRFAFADKSQVKLLRDMISPVYLRKAPLVSLDVEAYERSPLKITEIGIAVYDPEGQWLLQSPQIKSLHILTKENLNLYNGTFVADRKLYFNGGVSYSISEHQLTALILNIFKHYLTERGGFLVGHDVKGDIKWLGKLGITVNSHNSIVDTLRIYLLTEKKNGSLRKILRKLNIPHANLHNAGNDAYYTLLAALSLCDPQQRVKYNLDSVDTSEHVPLTKSQKWKAKFSDEVEVRHGRDVPDAADFFSL